jgi:hypothetical protein
MDADRKKPERPGTPPEAALRTWRFEAAHPRPLRPPHYLTGKRPPK